jgi:hypothetical protein
LVKPPEQLRPQNGATQSDAGGSKTHQSSEGRLISAKNIKDATDPRPAIDKFGIKVLSPGAAVECIRQRFFPLTAGDMQGLAERVLAPH